MRQRPGSAKPGQDNRYRVGMRTIRLTIGLPIALLGILVAILGVLIADGWDAATDGWRGVPSFLDDLFYGSERD